MSWTKDTNVSNTWYEDNSNTEWGDHFNEITERFTDIGLSFINIGGISFTEDSVVATTWSED